MGDSEGGRKWLQGEGKGLFEGLTQARNHLGAPGWFFAEPEQPAIAISGGGKNGDLVPPDLPGACRPEGASLTFWVPVERRCGG